MIRFLVRALIASVPRFLIIMALLNAVLYFETSPLPEALTYLVLAYLIHFGATYLAGAWIFAKHRPEWLEIGAITLFVLVFGTFLEIAAYVSIFKRSWSIAFSSYTWESLIVILVYAAAVVLAGWRARMKHPSIVPEGINL